MQLQDFHHRRRVQNIKKARRPRTTDSPEEGPEALNYLKAAGVGQQLQLFKALGHRPRREQPQPLPTVKRGQ